MGSIGTVLRRTIFLVALAAGVGALVSRRRGHSATPVPSAPPQWPPLPGQPAPLTLARQAAPVGVPGWLAALDDGSTPPSHPVKAKESSGIFHVPGGRFYDRTKPERCYATAADAEADGYRQSMS